jgi:serine O-acetyltransferase
MFSHLKRDSVKYAELGGWWANPGFWIVAVYRFGVWADTLPGLLRLPFWILYRIAHLPYWLFNVHLWAGKRGARIGPGLCLIHPNNIYFGPGVVVGEDCNIFHEVTLGMGHIPGTPKIGNNTTIFTGARLLGGLTVGENVVVGANCVVMRNVPSGAILMPPANRTLPRALSPYAREQDRLTPASGDGSTSPTA